MSYDDEVLADSPVSYWKLEETVPGNPFPVAPGGMVDFASAFNNWYITGFGLTQGITGPILTDASSFGASGVIGGQPPVATGSPLDIRGDLTWECFAKTTATGCETMINRGGDATDTYLAFGSRSTGLFEHQALWVLQWAPLDIRTVLSCPLDVNVWYHIVGTRTGTDMILYVNSWVVDSRTDCPTGLLLDESAWRLGYMSNFAFGPVNPSAGLSHVALYNHVLSPTRIRAHTIAALGSLPNNPCGPTPFELECPIAETGIVNEPYDSTLLTIGGTAPYTYEIISGELPDGLSLNTNTGEISGTPIESGPFDFVVRATDADLNTADTPGCGLVIEGGPNPPPPPVSPPIETCPENQPASNPIQRVQRVLDFTQAIHRNIQLQISTVAPLTLFGYSMEWVPVSVSELTEQRNAYAASFQFAEWGHFFQAYIAYISTQDLIWNITVDGVGPDAYLLPSTGGSFVKQWIILRARKGKLFDWSFSSAAEFQIIPSQSVLLAKEFKTQGAYQQLQPFGDQT